MTPLRRRSLVCARASARALAAPSFRCDSTVTLNSPPHARADDPSDCARRRRADAPADAPADALPYNHANTLADALADAPADADGALIFFW